MSGQLVPGATRALSQGEQELVLKNQVLFLEEQIAELEARIDALVDDNAEMDFLAGVNQRARTEAHEELYRANVSRIEQLRLEVAASAQDIDTYRRVLVERFGGDQRG